MTKSASDLYKVLDGIECTYKRYDHEPVFTVEQAKTCVPKMEALGTKNLFLRNKAGKRHFLVLVPEATSVDLKALSALLEAGRLGFASEERLMRYLGLTPGAVSVLALVNDTERSVELIVDYAVWEASQIQAHPLVNTATLALPQQSLQKFLQYTGHEPLVITVPLNQQP